MYYESSLPICNVFQTKYDGGYILANRWVYDSKQSFLSKFGASNIWSVTNSYRLLLISGEHVIRIWTDSPRSCIVDLHPALAKVTSLPVRDVPESVLRKTSPLVHRLTLKSEADAKKLLKDMKLLWA